MELGGVTDLLGSSSAEKDLAVLMGTKPFMILQSAFVAKKASGNFKLSSKVWLFLEDLGLLRPLFSHSQRLSHMFLSGLIGYIH